jgi:Rrf2 family protein
MYVFLVHIDHFTQSGLTMSGNFITATHIMAYLSYAQGNDQVLSSSKEIAHQIQNNPVAVRRLMQSLSAANLIKTQKGVNGGAALIRPAKDITLLDIFEAVKGDEVDLFAVQAMERAGCSTMIDSIQQTLSERLNEVRAAMNQSLAAISIHDVLHTSQLRIHSTCD